MVYTPTYYGTYPIPLEPAVLSCFIQNTSAESNLAVYVPWEYCQMDYCYEVQLVANQAGSSSGTLDLELDAAAGTELYTMTIASSAAVGTIVEGTLTTVAPTKNLGRHDTARDAVNIEVISSNAAGAMMLYMYFTSERP